MRYLSVVDKQMVSVTSFKNPRRVIEALAKSGPMSKWKLKEETQLDYSRVHEVIKRLQKRGYVKVFEEIRSKKNLPMSIYGLTFKGVMAYLASFPLKYPTPHGKVGETTEDFKKRYVQEFREYLKRREDFEKTLEDQGKLLDYVIFKEIRWLAKHYIESHICSLFLQISESVEAYSRSPESPAQRIRRLQREKSNLIREKEERPAMLPKKLIMFTEVNGKRKEWEVDLSEELNNKISQKDQELKVWREIEHKLLEQRFSEQFFRQLSYYKNEGEMHNEALRQSARGLLEKMKREIAPWEKIVGLFSGRITHAEVASETTPKPKLEPEKKESPKKEEPKREQKKELTWHEVFYGTK